MRLIDADKLETKLMKAADKFSRKKPRTTLIILFAVDILRCAETVKATPERHGKWIKRFGNRYLFYIYDCSECKYPNPTKTKYCPNCGAKMNGGDENEEKY